MKNQVIITAHNLYSKLPLVVKNIAAKVKAIATAIVKNENTCHLFKSVMSIVYIIDIKKHIMYFSSRQAFCLQGLSKLIQLLHLQQTLQTIQKIDKNFPLCIILLL